MYQVFYAQTMDHFHGEHDAAEAVHNAVVMEEVAKDGISL